MLHGVNVNHCTWANSVDAENCIKLSAPTIEGNLVSDLRWILSTVKKTFAFFPDFISHSAFFHFSLPEVTHALFLFLAFCATFFNGRNSVLSAESEVLIFLKFFSFDSSWGLRIFFLCSNTRNETCLQVGLKSCLANKYLQ